MNPFSMFIEKSSGDRHWSMTRTVAFMFAVTYCIALYHYAHAAHDVTWPFTVLGIVIVLAVPLQALFVFLQTWLQSSPGQQLVQELIEEGARKLKEHA